MLEHQPWQPPLAGRNIYGGFVEKFWSKMQYLKIFQTKVARLTQNIEQLRHWIFWRGWAPDVGGHIGWKECYDCDNGYNDYDDNDDNDDYGGFDDYDDYNYYDDYNDYDDYDMYDLYMYDSRCWIAQL